MDASELVGILATLPKEAKQVVVLSRRDCKISASIPIESLIGLLTNGYWAIVNEPSYARDPGWMRVIYAGPLVKEAV
jgi:hypothetical protein